MRPAGSVQSDFLSDLRSVLEYRHQWRTAAAEPGRIRRLLLILRICLPPPTTWRMPSPRHKAFARPAHKARIGIPESFGVVPSELSYWGNQTYGDCVSAEEAVKAVYSLMGGGGTELFITEQEVINWCRADLFLNGADLTSVMEQMASTGMVAQDGNTYTDGPYESVNWTDDATLSSAIYTGPVKIGVASSQLDNVVGTTNGWFATGFSSDQNEDHCINLIGFGTIAELSAMLGVVVPPGVDGTARWLPLVLLGYHRDFRLCPA